MTPLMHQRKIQQRKMRTPIFDKPWDSSISSWLYIGSTFTYIHAYAQQAHGLHTFPCKQGPCPKLAPNAYIHAYYAQQAVE